jgi:hypothetical protein
MTGDPKSGVFEGREGSGLAQFLGNRPDAFQTTQQPINMLYNLKLREKQEQQAAEKRKRDALAKLSSYDPIFTQSETELADDFGNVRELYTEIWSEGGDPESDPRFMEALPKWNMKHTQNKAVKEYVDKIKQNLATGNYDEEYAIAEIEKIMNAPTIGERFELTRQTDPLIPKVQLFKDAPRFTVEPDIVRDQKGNVRTAESSYDPEKVDTAANAYILAHPEEVEFYEAKYGNGRPTEVVLAEYKEKLTPLLTRKGLKDEKTIVSAGANFTMNVGGGVRGKTFSSQVIDLPAFGDGKRNGMQFTGPDAERPFAFTDAGGNLTYIKPELIKRDENNNLILVGKKAKRVSDQIKREVEASGGGWDDMKALAVRRGEATASAQIMEDDNGEVVIVETSDESIPVYRNGSVDAWYKMRTGGQDDLFKAFGLGKNQASTTPPAAAKTKASKTTMEYFKQ